MPTEHPNVVMTRNHFDLMADQYDELFIRMCMAMKRCMR